MITRRSIMPGRVSNGTVISAIALLIGILVLAAGYYSHSQLLTYIGLILIVGGVLTEAVFSTLARKS